MFLVGPSGVGKSTIVHDYWNENPPEDRDERTVRPVIYGSLKKGGDRAVMATLLRAAGDVAPDKGKDIQEMIHRLARHVAECGTRLIIVDEIHHVLPEHNTTARTQIAADLIKSLIDELQASLVLVGLPESQRLLNAQRRGDADKDQLRRRFRRTVHIEPPALSDKEWKDMLGTYQDAMGVPCIRLFGEEMRARLYLATNGLHGRLANLLVEVLEEWDGQSQVTLEDFARAHEESASVHDIPENPFTIAPKEVERHLQRMSDRK